MDNFSSKNAGVENDHTENHMLKIGALLDEKCECSWRYNRLLFRVHNLVNAFLRKLLSPKGVVTVGGLLTLVVVISKL